MMLWKFCDIRIVGASGHLELELDLELGDAQLEAFLLQNMLRKGCPPKWITCIDKIVIYVEFYNQGVIKQPYIGKKDQWEVPINGFDIGNDLSFLGSAYRTSISRWKTD